MVCVDKNNLLIIIIIFNAKNRATTGLKISHGQYRELDYIKMVNVNGWKEGIGLN